MPKRFTGVDNTLETHRADFSFGIRACLIDGDEGNADANDDFPGIFLVREQSTGLVRDSAVKVTGEVEVGFSEAFCVKTVTTDNQDIVGEEVKRDIYVSPVQIPYSSSVC